MNRMGIECKSNVNWTWIERSFHVRFAFNSRSIHTRFLFYFYLRYIRSNPFKKNKRWKNTILFIFSTSWVFFCSSERQYIRVTSRITHTKFTNTTSCSPYFKTFLLYKCTKIFHPLHSGFIPALAKLYAKM